MAMCELAGGRMHPPTNAVVAPSLLLFLALCVCALGAEPRLRCDAGAVAGSTAPPGAGDWEFPSPGNGHIRDVPLEWVTWLRDLRPQDSPYLAVAAVVMHWTDHYARQSASDALRLALQVHVRELVRGSTRHSVPAEGTQRPLALVSTYRDLVAERLRTLRRQHNAHRGWRPVDLGLLPRMARVWPCMRAYAEQWSRALASMAMRSTTPVPESAVPPPAGAAEAHDPWQEPDPWEEWYIRFTAPPVVPTAASGGSGRPLFTGAPTRSRPVTLPPDNGARERTPPGVITTAGPGSPPPQSPRPRNTDAPLATPAATTGVPSVTPTTTAAATTAAPTVRMCVRNDLNVPRELCTGASMDESAPRTLLPCPSAKRMCIRIPATAVGELRAEVAGRRVRWQCVCGV